MLFVNKKKQKEKEKSKRKAQFVGVFLGFLFVQTYFAKGLKGAFLLVQGAISFLF
jgi:hypothetical protein